MCAVIVISFFLISAIILGSFITIIAGFAAIVAFFRNLRKKEKRALFEKLLDNDNEMNEMGEGGKDMDMSIFNLEFNDFKIIQDIGSGGSGALCLEGLDKKNDEKVFIKLFVLRKKEGGNNEWDLSEFKNEVHHLSRLRHTNIVTFYGLFYAPPARVGYVCEFCQHGSLFGFIKKLKSMPPEKNDFDTRKKLDWMIQIAKGMRYLHQKGVIFRDLKPENILIGKNGIMKITDFGISKLNDSTNKQMMTRAAGTSIYMAPEVVLGGEYGNAVDVFSFGILMYEIIFETENPYGSNVGFGIEVKVAQDPELRPKIEMGIFTKKHEFPIIQSLVDLMKKCWQHNPTTRPDFRQICNILSQQEEEFEKLDVPKL